MASLDSRNRASMNAIVCGNLPMSSMVSQDRLHLLGRKLGVSSRVCHYRATDTGKTPALLNISDHGTGDAVVLSNLPISAWVSADCSGIIGCQLVPTVAAFVGHLFLARRPSAILWRIALGVIDTLKGQIRRGTCAHISQEVSETVPASAYRDATSAVIFIVDVARLIAAGMHRSPNEILRSLRHGRIIGEVNAGGYGLV